MKRRTIWLCRDRRGERVFLERPTWHTGHDLLIGKEASFDRVVKKRSKYRVVTKFLLIPEGPFETSTVNYVHRRAGCAPL